MDVISWHRSRPERHLRFFEAFLQASIPELQDASFDQKFIPAKAILISGQKYMGRTKSSLFKEFEHRSS